MKTLGLMGLGLLVIFFACERINRPRLGSQAFKLQELTTLVTETYLQLSGWDWLADATLRVYRNGQVLWDRSLQPGDTVLYDSTLAPARTYTYRAELWGGGQRLARSGPVTVTTLDTTSHDFEWEIIEFPSPFGSGVLYDVAIVDDNDIWAVGEIYADSAQPWLPYNAVHWDGEKWELKRIRTNACGGVDYPPIKTIFAFSSNDILFAHIDGSITHFNGNSFTNDCSLITQLNGSVNKMWGTSSKDFYIVGNNGLIAHYDGVSWRRVECGTELNITDIYGSWNPIQQKWEILCVASRLYETLDRKIYIVHPDRVQEISSQGITQPLLTLWCVSGGRYYVAGSGIYEKRQLWEGRWRNDPLEITRYLIHRIRGNHVNDVVAVGGWGEVLHYNGMSWRSYYRDTHIDGNYYSVSMKGDWVVAVGSDGGAGVVLIGRRR